MTRQTDQPRGLTRDEREFLERLARCPGGFATRGLVGCVVDRAQDRARQSCRRKGYVEHQGSAHGAAKSGWALLPAGRLALQQKDTAP